MLFTSQYLRTLFFQRMPPFIIARSKCNPSHQTEPPVRFLLGAFVLFESRTVQCVFRAFVCVTEHSAEESRTSFSALWWHLTLLFSSLS